MKQGLEEAKAIPETLADDTLARQQLRQQIEDKLYGEGAPVKEREAHIILGLPASGKSALATPLAEKTGSLIIDSDEAKAMLPEFKNGLGAAATHKESSEIVWQQMFERAVVRGDNIILPLVGKTYENIANTADTLRRFGYTVHIEYVQVPVDEAINRAVRRYASTGRLVSPEYLQSVGDQPKVTYARLKAEKLASSFEWYNNVGPKPRYVPGR